ncbi:ferredoxin [Mycolicibacterium holsaticum]|jgi:ferredoxin|uniref:ferredoxin n=1 Tax=Mycolicibacterium holsaticum TaxID=152142 RepID=UPI000A03880F|nr:ferredoxin [Mycolicibacterium holsaticum]
MGVVKADRSRCQGYGNCVLAAPQIFGVDDEGLVTVLRQNVSVDDVPDAQAAIRSCPVAAISFVQS